MRNIIKRPIVINERNLFRLQAELDTVQSRSRARKIDAEHLMRLSRHYHTVLRRYFRVKDMEGLRLSLSPYAQTYPRAYKYRPEGTAVEIIYEGGSWRLLSASREFCDDPKQLATITYLPQVAQATALERITTLSL